MKTLKLSTVATALCLICMSMGFPNLEEEGKGKDQGSGKKSDTTYMRAASLGCSRGVQLPTPKLTSTEVIKPAGKAENPVCSTTSASKCQKKTV
jgi:hypothetical protein